MRLTSLLLPVATICVLLAAPAAAQNYYGWSLRGVS
jgi:hypothetical protein